MRNLHDLPRVRLGVFPTPFYRLDRLSEQYGRGIWIKRDDLCGVALGGNKVRKLEYLLADAQKQGCDTVFTTEYSVRTAMEAVYGLLGVDRGVPEVWGSVYDIRELLHSTVCLMDGRSPLEVPLPGPLELLKKPLLKAIRGTVIEKVLRDQDVLRDGM